MREQTPRTIGPKRCTKSANAATSRWTTKRSSNCASEASAAAGGLTNARKYRSTSAICPLAIFLPFQGQAFLHL
jgi:hypothetical protein